MLRIRSYPLPPGIDRSLSSTLGIESVNEASASTAE
jgi:hypothetical protein